jgi:arabinofuranosyltransferase
MVGRSSWRTFASAATSRAFLLGLLAPAVLLVAMLAWAPLVIDDAYISFRYARNLARGLGLVYNVGERVEGYTDFLWTVLVAGGLKLHLDPLVVTKILGGGSALGSLVVVWALALRLHRGRLVPPIATWLLASSATFAGYAMAGLETSFFVFLILLGTWQILVERDQSDRFPWSGLVYALAALTRPEAPLYFGIAVLALGRQAFGRQNLIRAAVFLSIVGGHLLWRRAYYGVWVPNTVLAKTGGGGDQTRAGLAYLRAYVEATGPLLLGGVVGVILAVRRSTWLRRVVVATALAGAASVVAVGGDWMPLWRFMAPVEPFVFLLVDLGFRSVAEPNPEASASEPPKSARLIRGVVWVALALFAGIAASGRAEKVRTQLGALAREQRGWDSSALPVARWFAERGQPGLVALGDIGYVGWATDYPILDILGLVDPEIAELPGSYGQKLGPRYLDYFFSRQPDYFILISGHDDCDHPFHPPIAAVYQDAKRRLHEGYRVVHRVPVGGNAGWCIYGRSPPESRSRTLFDFETGFAGWEVTGDAFADGPATGPRPNQMPVSGVGGHAFVNSFHPTLGDRATGALLSPTFTIDRDRLSLFVAGGAAPGTRVELFVDGRVEFRASGVESEDLHRVTWDVYPFAGRIAQLRIVDEERGPWGHILVDDVVLADGR